MDLFAYIDRTEPGSPTSTTSVPLPPSEDPSARPFSELEALGRTTYRDAWNEFYDWEPGYCAEILGTVTQSFLASKREVARVAKAMVTRLAEPQERVPKRVDETAMVVSVTSFVAVPGRRGTLKRTTDVSIPVVTMDAFPAHPLYESCPPISRSVLMNTYLGDILPFLPYADEERFPAREYQEKFLKLEWETPFDPDAEMIQIETVRRLQAKAVDIEDIDRMNMFKQFRLSHNTGLLWDQSQRDVLHWPGAFKFEPTQEVELPVYTPDADDLRQRLMSNLRAFCPSINCLHSVCETHDQMHTSSYIPSRKPKLTAQDMILSEGLPCGPDCFRHIQDLDMFMETLPPSPTKSHHTGSMDTLEIVLGLAPDLFPCRLAIICLKPCKLVFVQRLQLFPDQTILSSILPGTDVDMGGESSHNYQRRRTREKLQYVDSGPIGNYELWPACGHPGSCTSHNCTCYDKKQHCTLMCRCGVKCKRQWPGCNCTNGRCELASCSCLKGSRECIPGICISCDAGGKETYSKTTYSDGQTGKACTNTRMQRLASKPIEIKCGTFGLGAFACQTMSSGSFLGTYAGYILSPELADPMSDLAKHTSLNYMFEISSDGDVEDIQLPILDAAYLGNATRFLNHKDDDQANVAAKPMVVIGEHQIGFFTTRRVRAGEELFLDYGRNYWRDTRESE